MQKLSYLYGIVVFGSLLFLSLSCGPKESPILSPSKDPLVWPPAPEQARIQYMGMIDTEDDMKSGKSGLPSVFEVLFGKKDRGVLLAPSAVAFDGQGRLFVSDRMGGVVHVFGFQGKNYFQFGTLTDEETLQNPVALTLVADAVFVVDSTRKEICVFDTKGDYRFSFGAGHLKRPTGIAYVPSTQEIFVVDTAEHNLKVFDRSGRYRRTFGARGASLGRFNFPTYLWVDSQERLYVSDTLNYRIQIMNRQGGILGTFGSQGDRPGYFGHPCGVATDRQGHIYVVDRQFENIQVFDARGQILMAFGQEGSDPGEFWLPSGLFIDQRNWIYVADTYNKRIQIFRLIDGGGDDV